MKCAVEFFQVIILNQIAMKVNCKKEVFLMVFQPAISNLHMFIFQDIAIGLSGPEIG